MFILKDKFPERIAKEEHDAKVTLHHLSHPPPMITYCVYCNAVVSECRIMYEMWKLDLINLSFIFFYINKIGIIFSQGNMIQKITVITGSKFFIYLF